MINMSDLTQILNAIQKGNPQAADQLLTAVYDELRGLAMHKMANEAAGQTLQATALVHEAWLRLAGSGPQQWQNRGHFFAAAAEAMRRILIERARQKASLKHGGRLRRVDFDQIDLATETESEVLLVLDEALERFALKDPAAAQLIKLRFFAGVPNDQAAALLGLSERTAKRHWAYARAWLGHEVQKNL
jgi:RNA polymerase sigma factor (TIGR02999 family)